MLFSFCSFSFFDFPYFFLFSSPIPFFILPHYRTWNKPWCPKVDVSIRKNNIFDYALQRVLIFHLRQTEGHGSRITLHEKTLRWLWHFSCCQHLKSLFTKTYFLRWHLHKITLFLSLHGIFVHSYAWLRSLNFN